MFLSQKLLVNACGSPGRRVSCRARIVLRGGASMTTVTRRIGLALGLVAVLVVSACGGGDGGAGDENRITVWTAEDLPDRVAAFEAIAARFTEQTGIQVEHVPVSEDQFAQLLTSTAAAGELPD